MKEEKRVKIFLALTSIHRKIKNNEGKITVFSPGNKETLSLAIDTSNENWFRLEP